MTLKARCFSPDCSWTFEGVHWDEVLVAAGSHSMLLYHFLQVDGLGVRMVIKCEKRK